MRLAVALFALVAASAAEYALIQPKELASRLQVKAVRPTLIHVGFNVLYRNRHIPNSLYAGPANTPQGLNVLRTAAGKLPRNTELVVYCGCCPWDACPNITPAIRALKQMGFTNVKALYIPTNMAEDWFALGYPAEGGDARAPSR